MKNDASEELKRKETLKVMISGHGGQGVLDIGNFIAYQALKDGFHVVYTPTYGPETRGGKVRCWVTASSEAIDSPIAEVLDVLLIFNKPSMDFLPQLRPGGLLIYNISIIDRKVERDDIRAVPIPCSELASELGKEIEKNSKKMIDTTKTLNCIMYGGFLYLLDLEMEAAIFKTEAVFRQIYQGKKASFIPVNIAAVKKGFTYLKEYPKAL